MQLRETFRIRCGLSALGIASYLDCHERSLFFLYLHLTLALCHAPRPSGSHLPTFAIPQTPARALFKYETEMRVGMLVSVNHRTEELEYRRADVTTAEVPPETMAMI